VETGKENRDRNNHRDAYGIGKTEKGLFPEGSRTEEICSTSSVLVFRLTGGVCGSFSCVIKKGITPHAEEKIRKEREMYAKVGNHPNVLLLLDGWNEFLMLESMEADLFHIVDALKEEGKLMETNHAICTLRGMVSGLSHMHSLRIAHHDVKLENTLIGSGGRLKLCDLDHARQYSEEETICSSIQLGTVRYKAPETFVSPHDPFSADVWSLGVCAFALAQGKMPFHQATAFCPLYASVFSEAEVVSSLCSKLSLPHRFPFLDLILVVDPTRRPRMSEICF